MKVLTITGDKNFASSERFRLQATQVDTLKVLYWGRGALFPRLPEGEFDVVTVQDPLLRGVFARRAAKKTSARVNIQVHMDLDALPVWKRMLVKFNLRHASSVRVVSEKIKKQIESLGVKAPIYTLPIYVDISKFKQIVRRPSAQKTILWVGRFEGEKDPLSAIDMLKEVRETGIDAKLIMLGQGSLEKSLRQSAAGLPVEFPGWQDTVPSLAQADVVLCTSLHESWGASIVEALAAGVPVVAPDVGVAREAGAIVVPRGKLADAIVKTLREGTKGELKLHLLTKEEWAIQWKQSL